MPPALQDGSCRAPERGKRGPLHFVIAAPLLLTPGADVRTSRCCRREKYCDFCSGQLPDWKSVLTPNGNTSAPAVMNVNFDNKTYSFQVSPGADGYRQFTEAIRKAFHLPEDSELNITFTCDEPSTGGQLGDPCCGPAGPVQAVHAWGMFAAEGASCSSACITAAWTLPYPGVAHFAGSPVP